MNPNTDPRKNEKTDIRTRIRRSRFFWPWLLSLLVHGLGGLGLLLSPHFSEFHMPPNQKTEVELLDPDQIKALLQKPPPDVPQGQVVEQDEKALNDEKPKETKFLSRHNQVVVQQTQAQVHGQFKNTDGSSGPKTPERHAGKPAEATPVVADPPKKPVQAKVAEKAPVKEQPKRVEKSVQKLANSADGIPVRKKPELKDLIPSFKPVPPPDDGDSVAQGGGDGPSSTDDHLKDVRTGMQTLLSTREFVYYSYYNRIKDKLRQYWEPKIKEKVEKIIRQGRTIASADRITKVVIILDSSGTLVRVQVIGPSGVNDLDDAAVEAFRAAAPFPNPPHGIADPDGTIKIRWDFILEA